MLDHLIHQYGKRLYGLCLTLCANKYDAEDLYQDTWIKVLQYLDKYDPVREFEPWLTAICVNTYRDRLRRLKKSPLFHGFRSNEEKDRLLAKAEAPTTPDYAPLYTAIDRLPESLRLIESNAFDIVITEPVILPAGVEMVQRWAFSGCGSEIEVIATSDATHFETADEYEARTGYRHWMDDWAEE